MQASANVTLLRPLAKPRFRSRDEAPDAVRWPLEPFIDCALGAPPLVLLRLSGLSGLIPKAAVLLWF